VSRRWGSLTLVLAALAGVMLPAVAAGAAPGDITRVAGQGPDANCTADLRVDPSTGQPVFPQDDGTPGLEDARWNYHTNFGGIAAAGGRLYVAQANRVRGPSGLVVGLTPGSVAASDPDGAPATKVSLGRLGALAVDPGGNHLYLAETVVPVATIPEHARVWRLGLAGTAPVLRKVATTAGPVGGLAADASGRVFIGEASGDVSAAAPGGTPAEVASFAPHSITSLAVDPSGTNLFATDTTGDKVLHLNLASGGAPVVIAGAAGNGDSGDNGLAPLARLDAPRSVAFDGLGVYFVDQPVGEARVRRIDLETLTINTVVGPGAAGEAADLVVPGKGRITVDKGNVFLGDFDQCQVLMVESASAAAVPPAVNNPVGPPPPNNTGGTGGTGDSGTNSSADQGAPASNPVQGSSGDAGSPATDQAGSGSAGTENQTGIVSSTTGAENQTGIISSTTGAESQAAPGPGEQGSVSSAQTPAQTFQPSANAPAAPSANPSTAPAPQPPAAPEAVAVADPGAAASSAAEPASVTGSALPPGSPQAAGHLAPAGAHDAESAPGAPRYAMVRSQEGAEVGAAVAAVGAALAVIFCVLLAGPGAVARPKPRPRPKGAY
jgi:hypothetical protein